MGGWKELLIDVLKLTDETKRLNQDIDRLQSHVVDVDKRVVRLETLIDIAKYTAHQERILKDSK
ncbi:hypothetical protein JYT30_00820 [Desulfotalea psychrophila]|nr:hypothetical protein [Desulfocapsa sp.]MBN4065512.1 hypothetical protein [Desulfocapsa sp. AH-315-G09]MBN4071685.1 hypothetical protein [Desulfotalea psychrophila]